MPDDPDDTPKIPIEDVRKVFDHWQELLCPRPRKLDDKRTALIRRAITTHGIQDCLDAISGCTLSEWHLGRNPQRKRYTDIELILRDAKHVEMFSDLWHDRPEGTDHASEVAW